jgi:hypothetical protein
MKGYETITFSPREKVSMHIHRVNNYYICPSVKIKTAALKSEFIISIVAGFLRKALS